MDRRNGVADWRASTFGSSQRFAKLASGKVVWIIFVTLYSFETVPLIDFRIFRSSRNSSDNEEYQSFTGIFHSFLDGSILTFLLRCGVLSVIINTRSTKVG